MTGLTHLRDVAVGRRPADDGLLGNTRCRWAGIDLLSEESILAEFTAQPFGLDGPLHAVETPHGAALIGEDRALFADLYDGRIGRLWRIGGAPTLPPEPAISVAFDADMRQARGDLHLRAEDHPTLTADATEPLLAAARGLIETVRQTGKLRVRGFVVRAGCDAAGSAALIALFTLSNEQSREAAFVFAAIGIDADGVVRSAIDRTPPSGWTPRL